MSYFGFKPNRSLCNLYTCVLKAGKVRNILLQPVAEHVTRSSNLLDEQALSGLHTASYEDKSFHRVDTVRLRALS